MSEVKQQAVAQERAPRYAGPRHVVELPLSVMSRDHAILDRRFAAANSLRNGLLQAGRQALVACRADPVWQAARLLPRATVKDRRARSAAFQAIRDSHGLTEAALEKIERQMRQSCWIGDHLTMRLGRVIVKQVMTALEGHMFLGRGRPRFRKREDCRTIAAEQDSPIRLRGSVENGLFIDWSGLRLQIRRRDFSASERHSLACRRIACRIKRIPSGFAAPRPQWRYAVQITVRGAPYVTTPRARTGVLGLDMGPALVGAVWRDGPVGSGHTLISLAGEVVLDEVALRRSLRLLDRQRRAANPGCFDEKKRWIKGRKIRHQSQRHRAEMAKRRRKEVRAAEHRRNCHGRDGNRLLAVATEVRIEDHGYRGWATLWGRQLGRGMPGHFVSELSRKLRESGGTLVQISTQKATLSQIDVATGARERKPLGQRFHALGNGAGFIQRDLHSALLAAHCDANGVIDLIAARDHLAQCHGLVRRTAAEAARDAEAARTVALPPSRRLRRQSRSNENRAAPVTRKSMSRRQRRRDWLRDRIVSRCTRKNRIVYNDPVQLTGFEKSPASSCGSVFVSGIRAKRRIERLEAPARARLDHRTERHCYSVEPDRRDDRNTTQARQSDRGMSDCHSGCDKE